MTRKQLFLAACLATFSASHAAQAADVIARKTIHLRAGPGKQYPIVEKMHAGTALHLYGCLEGWNWCEVADAYDRGWVSGTYLQTVYEHRTLNIVEFAPVYRVPVITYEIGPYWDTYYRTKPFYRERDVYIRRPAIRDVYVDRRHDHDDHKGRGPDRDDDDRRGHGDRDYGDHGRHGH